MYSSNESVISLVPSASAVVPVIAQQPRWYALQVRPRHEKKVAEELQEKGVSTYLPLVAHVHRWSDRRKIVQLPLFPCYTFINAVLLSQVRSIAVQTWGVLGFVGPQGLGAPIPDSEIESIRILLASNVALAPCPFLQVGQRVRVRGGALDGIEGTLVANGDHRLIISVSGIHNALSINIEGYDVQPI